MKTFRTTVAAVLASLVSSIAWAEDIALVLSNGAYRDLPRLYDSYAGDTSERLLRENGFRVFGGRNLSGGQLVAEADAFARAIGSQTDRAIVVLTGHFGTQHDSAWFLGVDARAPSGLNVGQQGLSIDMLARFMRANAGRAVLLLGTPQTAFETTGWLRANEGFNFGANGVTVIRSNAAALPAVLADGLLVPGRSLEAVINGLPQDAQVSGFVSRHVAFTAQPAQPQQDPEELGEFAYWSAIQDINSEAAMRAYLNRYPNGAFTSEANRRIRQFQEEERRRAREVEANLNLGVDDRREIQRALSILGFDPRGIDGVFGPATRTALQNWQGSRGFEATGYLNRYQLNALRNAAEARAAEIEEQARQRQLAFERQDRAFWRETGAGRDEQGLRTYLRRYPDGLFAEQAQARLREIVQQRRAEARREERQAWDNAAQADTINAYRQFLTAYPRSSFSETARARIEELRADNEQRRERKARLEVENSIIGNRAGRLIVERLLARLEFKPGDVDGEFTKDTRRAIRRFQRSRDIEVTGFIDQVTMVRLLSAF